MSDIAIKLELPYPPSANTLYRHRLMGRHVVLYKTAAHREYLGAVANAVRVQRIRDPLLDLLPFTGHVALEYRLFRPARRGDLDNPLKALLDALQHAGVFLNDSQVHELHGFKLLDRSRPRVEVIIREVQGE